MKYSVFRKFILLVLFLNTFFLNAKPYIVYPETSVTNISPNLYFYEDHTRNLSIQEVSSKDFKDKFFLNNRVATPYWLTTSAVWGKISLDLKKTKNNYYLLFHNPIMENVEVFIPDIHGGFYKIVTGHGVDINKRIIPDRKIIIPVRSPVYPNSNLSEGTIYFRVFSPMNEFDLKASLVTELGLSKVKEMDTAFIAGYTGIIIVMFIYNFFIFFSLRNKSYLIYIFYTLTKGILILGTQGITHEYVFSDFTSDLWNLGFFGVVSLIFGNLFVKYFLNLKVKLPVVNKLYDVINVLLSISFFIKFIDATYFNYIYFIFLLLSTILSLTSGLRLYKQYLFARDYTHAWLFSLTAEILYTIATSGVYIPATIYLVQIGHVFETVLLSLALARQIRYLQGEKKKLGAIERDIAFAEEIQKTLFPRSYPISPAYSLAGKYQPSNKMSGDFYDFAIRKDNIICIIMVDVAGHGYAAGLIAAMVKVAFHETLESSKSASIHQNEINRILSQNVQTLFATAINLRIDPAKKMFYVSRAGHMPLLHFKRAENTITEYFPKGIPLGILKNHSYEEISVKYKKGDRLILFTDGIPESENIHGKAYGLNQFQNEIMNFIHDSTDSFCDNLIMKVNQWSRKVQAEDDIALIAIDLH